MAQVVNFRQARKRKLKTENERQAAGNRAKFGRTKAEKNREAAEADRNRRLLDQAKLTRHKEL